MAEEFERLWAGAHARAISWVKLGLPRNILDDPQIPDKIRDRIWRFVQGSDSEPSESLPHQAPEKWFDDLEGGSNWIQYIGKLTAKGWPDKAIQSVEESTRKVMNFLFDPSASQDHQKYGLVVGRVQSGKTANYGGLIARAVDSGFDIIIVLAGLHNNLRKQTQKRLEEEIAKFDPKNPVNRRLIPLTDESGDFKRLPSHQLFNPGTDRAVLLVVKKNVSPLTHLVQQLRELEELERLKLNLLVIDDEADHATINTRQLEEVSGIGMELDAFEDFEEDERDTEITDVTRINSSIRQILGLFKRYSYVGYTATPFANILIDPNEDHPSLGPTLYPRDFILALPKPDGYSGLEEFFPITNEEEHSTERIKIVPSSDATSLRELDAENEVGRSSELPDSLVNALMDFIISGALRLLRKGEPFHHTMLVHVKHTKSNQSPVYSRINELMQIWEEEMPNDYSHEGQELREKLKGRWVHHFEPQDSAEEKWCNLEVKVIEFLSSGIEVMLINSDTGDDLDYEANEEKGLHVIAVGGNRLSRGLTLEGLCCTYFVRESKMYDTLTQMGRWFGFRHGYEDLVRLHTTGLLVEWFTWLTSVERELLSDIHRYQSTDYTPTTLAVRILKHRAMLPTARNKMRNARIVSNTLSATTPRMTRFLFDDANALRSNIENVSEFFKRLGDPNAQPLGSPNSLLWRGVSPLSVLSLVQGHKHHTGDRTFDKEAVENYIEKRINEDTFSEWSVCLVSTSEGLSRNPFVEYGEDFSIHLPNRTRIFGRDSIGELIQASNIVIDLPGELSDYQVNGQVSYPRMYEARDPSNPLLLIYVIDRDSSPDVNSNTVGSRTSLFDSTQEKVDVVGLAMALPVNLNEAEDAEIASSEFWTLRGVEYEY